MPPKAKPGAKPGAKSAAKAPAIKSPPPATPEPVKEEKEEALPVYEAEARLREVDDEHWEALAGLAEPPEAVASVLQSVLALLGDPEPGNWSTAKAIASDPPALMRELVALGPWGPSNAQLQAVRTQLDEAPLGSLKPRSAAASPEPAPAKAGAKAKAKTKAPAKAAAPPPPPPGAPAAYAIKQLVEAFLAARESEKPEAFPMVPPLVPFSKLHVCLQQALFGGQAACIVCQTPAAAHAAALFCESGGAIFCDVQSIQVRVGLSKALGLEAARAELGGVVREAMGTGRRCVLLLGNAPPNLNNLCDAKQFPVGLFGAVPREETAKEMGVGDVKDGFHVVLIVQMTKSKAEKLMPMQVPSFQEEMAVLILDDESLPSHEALHAAGGETIAAGAARKAVKSKPCLRPALRLLALSPDKGSGAKADSKTTAAAPTGPVDNAEDDAGALVINAEEFEFFEDFGEGWEERWQRGPATQDANGKPLREGLIKAEIVKYPANPKDAKPCMQLVSGAPNAACTGIWTSFEPHCRPTEVEFEFTIMGKVDLPNACVVFTERPFDGALPDARPGVQFAVRGGMQLSGGGGNLVRISNDGKIQGDKWNKVLLQIDWDEKIVIGQVDTRGKGYAPAMQTVPFRDQNCQAFSHLYIYNTDMQGTCWFSWIRVKQQKNVSLDTAALDARAQMAAKFKQKEYDAAVAADMEVGMKMGAIKSTAEHGMNLAEEQRANAGAGMAR